MIRCLVHKRFMIAGGAAAEVEVATQLSRWAKTLVVRTPLQLQTVKGQAFLLPGTMPSYDIVQSWSSWYVAELYCASEVWKLKGTKLDEHIPSSCRHM